MRRRLVGLPVVLAAAGALLAPACAPRKDPVRQLLSDAAARAEARDARGLAALLTDDFRAGDGSGRAEAEQALQRWFLAYGSLSVTLSRVTVEPGGDVAQAGFDAALSGTPRNEGLAGLLPRNSTYRFELRAVRESSGWKIAQATWRPAGGDGR